MTKKEILKELDRIARAMQSKEAFIEEYRSVFEECDTDRFYPFAFGILTSEISSLAAEGDILKACDIYEI